MHFSYTYKNNNTKETFLIRIIFSYLKPLDPVQTNKNHILIMGCPRGLMVKAMDCGIVVMILHNNNKKIDKNPNINRMFSW